MKTIAVKIWPPKICQACNSTNLYYKLDTSHEGDSEWCWCLDCNAQQVFWFQSCEEPE